MLHELREEPEPSLAALLAGLQPVDLVLVEGWKTGEPHDATIIAIASDPLLDPAACGRPGLPVFPLADLEGIAGFVAEFAGFVRD